MAAENYTKMDGKSLDITKENIAVLKELFPEIVEEGKIDFDKLKAILGEEVDSNDERYNFTWHGKNQAIRMSQTPSMGTLRPCKEESVDWDTTQNLYIEGDNLEVLKLLQKSYFGKVKMIYIDPPYNRGKDFVYDDDYSDSIDNYKIITGQISSDKKSVSNNVESDGRFHSKWSSMMYSRLKIARNMLSENGIMCVSIDDHEVHNLRKICDEIFGETNFITQLIWKKKAGGGSDSRYVAVDHEYILLYAKDETTQLKWSMPMNESQRADYKLVDDNYERYGPYKLKNLYQTGIDDNRPNLRYPIICPDGTELWPPTIWRWSKETFDEAFNNGEIQFIQDDRNGLWSVHTKMYLNKGDSEYEIKPRSILMNSGFTKDGNKELASLLEPGVFEYPKPIGLVKTLTRFISKENNDIILDFFSGSSSTAQAILDLSIGDGVKRKFIMIQLPENLDYRLSMATGSAKNTIQSAISFLDSINKPHLLSEIGKERIRRAGKEIRKNYTQTTIDGQKNNLDVGFKVFKLDSSNVKVWNPSGDVKHTLLDYENNIVSDSGRTNLDIVYEIMLKTGLELTSKVDVIDNGDVTLYSISSGALMICLDDIKDTTVAEKMISIHKEQNPFVWKVVFKDNGFASDDVKANTRETLKMAGLPEGSFVTL